MQAQTPVSSSQDSAELSQPSYVTRNSFVYDVVRDNASMWVPPQLRAAEMAINAGYYLARKSADVLAQFQGDPRYSSRDFNIACVMDAEMEAEIAASTEWGQTIYQKSGLDKFVIAFQLDPHQTIKETAKECLEIPASVLRYINPLARAGIKVLAQQKAREISTSYQEIQDKIDFLKNKVDSGGNITTGERNELVDLMSSFCKIGVKPGDIDETHWNRLRRQ